MKNVFYFFFILKKKHCSKNNTGINKGNIMNIKNRKK